MRRSTSFQFLPACALIAGLACRSEAPSSTRVLSPADLASTTLAADLHESLACSAETTGMLGPSTSGLWPYETFMVSGRAGEILRVELSASAAPLQVLLGLAEGNGFRVLDSVGIDTSGHLATELPQDGTYHIVVASGAARATTFTLGAGTLAPRDFDASGDPAASYALIASIEDYPRERVDLAGPHLDARLMRDLLVDVFGFPEENVVTLRDDEVTRRSLTEAWLGHLRRAGPEGLALFYFSGHGIQIDPLDETAAPEADAKDEALLLADGSVLVDQELGALAAGLRARRAMIVLDNCYAGTGTRGPGGAMKRTFVEDLDFDLRLPSQLFGAQSTKKSAATDEPGSYVLLAASAEDEVAWVSTQPVEASAPAPVSVFTWYLVRELSTLSDTTTLDEVMSQVHQRTLGFVRRTFGDNQTPHLEGSPVPGPVEAFLAGR